LFNNNKWYLQTSEDNIIKFLDEEILSQVTLETEGHKRNMVPRKNGAMEIPLKTQYYSKINESKQVD
jgi:hypothetical protein